MGFKKFGGGNYLYLNFSLFNIFKFTRLYKNNLKSKQTAKNGKPDSSLHENRQKSHDVTFKQDGYTRGKATFDFRKSYHHRTRPRM